MNNFQKRNLQRPKREIPITGDIFLIVCEGAKTEPRYFDFLRTKRKITTAQVEICGKECGSDQASVVRYAIKLKKERSQAARKKGKELPYDQVWCVFDKDNKPKKLAEALDLAKAHDIEIALSVPCFELWYLLHYKYSERPYNKYAELKSDLKRYIPKYSKDKAPYEELYSKLETAIENAERLRKGEKTNPKTDVDLLVSELLNVK